MRRSHFIICLHGCIYHDELLNTYGIDGKCVISLLFIVHSRPPQMMEVSTITILVIHLLCLRILVIARMLLWVDVLVYLSMYLQILCSCCNVSRVHCSEAIPILDTLVLGPKWYFRGRNISTYSLYHIALNNVWSQIVNFTLL